MKITVIVKGHKEVAKKVHKDVKQRAYDVFYRAGVEIVSIARRRYLSGGYPEHLRVGKVKGGTLRSNVNFKVDTTAEAVLLNLIIPDIAWYGRLWEAVNEYEYRQGEFFRNGTPKARPFFSPAIRDYWPKLLEKFRRLV